MSQLEDRNEIRESLGIPSDWVVLIFHGWFRYFPNKEAIDLIIRYLAPEISRNMNNVVFVIAGPDTPINQEGNIKFVGFVRDIYSLIHAADIAVVPILHGSGTRLKILDYMRMGVPVVTTKKGIEGIDARPNEHAIISDNVDKEFLDGIAWLVGSPLERERIGRNARDLVTKEYDWNRVGYRLDEALETVLEETSR